MSGKMLLEISRESVPGLFVYGLPGNTYTI